MRVSTGLGLAGLIVVGVIIADLIVHPAGTSAAGSALANVAQPTYAALLGNTYAPKSVSVK